MLDGLRSSVRTLIGRNDQEAPSATVVRRAHNSPTQVFEVDIPPNDPLVANFLSAPGAVEMRVPGMPLGLMPGMEYEERQMTLEAENCVLDYSDGLVEVHDLNGDMFGFPRLRSLLGEYGNMDMIPGGEALIQVLQQALTDFVGPEWEQEDDVTLVSLDLEDVPLDTNQSSSGERRRLLAFDLPSQPDNEVEAMRRVAEAVEGLGIHSNRLENLKTAVAEATMNAMEHGNQYREDLPVEIEVWCSDDELSIRISDHGGGEFADAQTPDLDAKLAGLQSPRGWGLFLIQKMVDEMNIFSDEQGRRVTELTMKLGGKAHE